MSVIDKPVTEPDVDSLEEIPVLPDEPLDPASKLIDDALNIWGDGRYWCAGILYEMGQYCAVGVLNKAAGASQLHYDIAEAHYYDGDISFDIYKRARKKIRQIIESKGYGESRATDVETIYTVNDSCPAFEIMRSIFEEARDAKV